MGESLPQGHGKMFERGGWRYAEDGFAEAEYFVGGTFEFICSRVTFRPRDDYLRGVFREEECCQAIGCGEEAVLGGAAGKGLGRFFCPVEILRMVRVCVFAREQHRGERVWAG